MGVEEPSNDYFRDNINMPLNDNFELILDLPNMSKWLTWILFFKTGFVNIKGQMSTES